MFTSNSGKIFISASAAVLLTACGGGGSSAPLATSTGVFLDSAVEGINYRTETQTGVTNSKGEFLYKDGERVTFSIGKIDFPSAAAVQTVTPLTLVGSTDLNNQKVSNILVLLQSLDQDGDPSNGISIPAKAATLATSAIDFDVPTTTFANSDGVKNLVAGSGSVNVSPISVAQAQAHFATTINAQGVNVQPVANAGTVQSVLTGTTVQLDASKSTDANEKDVITYKWTLAAPAGSSAILNEATFYKPTFVTDLAGEYVATLIVNDGKVDSAASTVKITVEDAGIVTPVDTSFQVSSTSFTNQGVIDLKYSGAVGGSNISPALAFTNIPGNATHISIVMDDETSPCSTGFGACVHWNVFDLPVTTTSITEGENLSSIANIGSSYLGPDQLGYAGPNPPSGTHTYKITVYATTKAIGMYQFPRPAVSRAEFEGDNAAFIVGGYTYTGTFTKP